MYPRDLSYKFINDKPSSEQEKGTIVFTIESKNKDFVKKILNALYLDLTLEEYDMDCEIIDKKLFLEKRKIFIAKKKKNVSEPKSIQMDA